MLQILLELYVKETNQQGWCSVSRQSLTHGAEEVVAEEGEAGPIGEHDHAEVRVTADDRRRVRHAAAR